MRALLPVPNHMGNDVLFVAFIERSNGFRSFLQVFKLTSNFRMRPPKVVACQLFFEPLDLLDIRWDLRIDTSLLTRTCIWP